jgi:hypothetical protein
MIRGDDSGSGWLALAERALLVSVLAATLAATLLVARSHLVPYQTPLSFGLVFWFWFFVLYAAIVWPTAGLVRLVGGRLGRRHPAARQLGAWAVAAAAGAFLVVTLSLNWRAGRDLLALEGPVRFEWLLPASSSAAALGLLATAVARRRRWPGRLLALLAVTSGIGALWPATPPAEEHPMLAGALTDQRFLLVGLDAADWSLADRLVERGELPVLADLKRRGAWGPLATLRPTQSPELWTTIFTGWPPWRHGIIGFTRPRMAGVLEVLPRFRRQRGTGFETLLAELERHQVIREVPVNNDMRRFPAYWNIASAYASPTNVVTIWPTWPAEEISGALVTERAVLWPPSRDRQPPPRLTYPESLFEEIAHLVLQTDDLDSELARRYMDITLDELAEIRSRPKSGAWDTFHQWDRFVARHQTAEGITLHLLHTRMGRDGRPADTLVWFDLVDKLCHTALRCSELVDEKVCEPEEESRLSRVVSEAYRTADATLGRLMAAFGDGNVIVVSDHGFARDPEAGAAGYTHRLGPPGIFVAAGPAFHSVRVEGLTVYDVLPTLLRLKGFALARDLRGRVPERGFSPAFLAGNPVVWIPSYGRRGVLQPASAATASDEQVLEELRGIGYIE